MKCPVCGKENPESASSCAHCGAALSEIKRSTPEAPKSKRGFWASIHSLLFRPLWPQKQGPPKKPTSKLAIASIVLALLGTRFGLVAWFTVALPLLPRHEGLFFLIVSLLSTLSLLAAFGLAIGAIIRSRRRARALSGTALAVAVLIFSPLVLFHRYFLAVPSAVRVWRKDSGVTENLGRVVYTRPPMGMAQESANRASCKNNLKQIGLALHIYASEHGGRFPAGPTAIEAFSELVEDKNVQEYALKPETFVCPAALPNVKAWVKTRKLTEKSCSYDYVPGLSESSPVDFILAYDKTPDNHWGMGRNVLFVDGHVEWWREDAGFQQALAEQRAKMASATSQSGGTPQ